MAPPTVPTARPGGTPTPAAAAGNKSTHRKPVVVPAIPLPYIQRQQKLAPTAAATTLPKDDKTLPPSDEPQTPRSELEAATSVPSPVTTTATSAVDGDLSGKTEALDVKDISREIEKPTQSAVVSKGTDQSPGEQAPLSGSELGPSNPPSASLQPSTASPPPPYNMPPPFQPASAGPSRNRGPIPEPVRLPQHNFNGRSHMHQHHPSNGSLVFGGFHGSNTSSPAPHSGGMFAPPVSMPYAPEQMPAAPIDEYGRPIMVAAPLDGYPRGANNYGPSTPHSFHDSQSSKHMDENGYGQPPFVNGHNGQEPKRYSGPPAAVNARYPPVTGPPPMLDMDNREEVNRIVQLGFANPEFADCELHLHLSDGASAENLQPPVARRPLHMPAHRLILARSPALRNLLLSQGTPNGKLHVPSDDPYLRSDAFWFAIQSLYGNPLHEVQPDPVEGSNNLEKFDLALGYAAAGALLQVVPITVQGVRDASRLINWGTLEKGLAFALAGATTLYPHGREDPSAQFLIPQYKHGVYVHDLVVAIMGFIIDNFPPNFVLDTTVPEPKYARLPSTPPFFAGSRRPEPMIAHGTSRFNPASHVRGTPGSSQMPQNPRLSNPRLSNIQFGDLSPLKSNGHGPSSQPSPTSPSDMVTSMLSRILLNLPFDLLKFVLESHGLGNVSGWVTSQDRHRVVSDVIAEREARRLRAVDAVAGGAVPNSQSIQVRLQGREPHSNGDIWDALAWKEDVSSASTDTPFMVRMWDPLPSPTS